MLEHSEMTSLIYRVRHRVPSFSDALARSLPLAFILRRSCNSSDCRTVVARNQRAC